MAINKNFIVDAGIELATTLTTGNSSVKSTVNSTVFTGTANNASYLDGQLPSYYTNATNIGTGTLAVARLADSSNIVAGAYGSSSAIPVITVDSKGRVTGLVNTNLITANSSTRGVLFVVDSVSNTDILSAASANSVRTTYVYAGNIAGTAYSNAVSVAATDATNKAANAYSNAVTVAATAYTNAITYSSNATNLTSGTISTARLGSGTANSSTYLRGDGTWTIAGITLSTNNSSANTFYLPMSANVSGTWVDGVISNNSLQFIPSTGTLFATNFHSLSDANKKTDISPITEALTTLSALRGVRFNWKDSGQPSAGLIAQDVETVMPELVIKNDDGVSTLNYNGVIGLLVEAVKELTARVEKLEATQ